MHVAVATPDTVAATRFPPWLLPTMPARVRDKLRPDILNIQGLPVHADIALTTASPSLCHLQRSCRIHIAEVGYCSDSSSRWLQARPAKELQQVGLCSALRDAGWVLAQSPAADPDLPVAAALPSACRYSVIMLGHTGTVFEPFTRYLKPFRRPAQDVRTLMYSTMQSRLLMQ